MKYLVLMVGLLSLNSVFANCRLGVFSSSSSIVNTYNGMGYSYQMEAKPKFLAEVTRILTRKGYQVVDMHPRDYFLDLFSSTKFDPHSNTHINSARLVLRLSHGRQIIDEKNFQGKAKYGPFQLLNIKASSGPGDIAMAQYDEKFFQSFFLSNLKSIPDCH
jgi:hypothetical protein